MKKRRLTFSYILVICIWMGIIICIASKKVSAKTSGDFRYKVLKDGTIEISHFTDYSATELVFPSEIDGKPVTSIGEHICMRRRLIKKIFIPDSVRNIGKSAFSQCSSLTDITISDGVVNIGSAAFMSCTDLSDIVIPDSVKFIGDSAFDYCINLKNIMLPDRMKKICEGTFRGCSSLTKIIIPGNIESIGQRAFKTCNSLSEIIMQDGVSEIGAEAFQECENLTDIVLPDSVTIIGDRAFQKCKSLAEIAMPDSVTDVGVEVFSNTSIISIVIPNHMITIGNEAFARCEKLKNVTIQEGTEKISKGAFQGCSSLMSIIIPNSVKSIEKDAFSNCGNLMYIYYAGSKGQWSKIRNKDEYLKIINICYNGFVKYGSYFYLGISGSKHEIKLTYSGHAEEISYQSSNRKVLSVDSKGRVKATGCGSAFITIRASTFVDTVKFIVIPGQVHSIGFKWGRKSVQVKWNAMRQVSGYQYAFAYNKEFRDAVTGDIGRKNSIKISNMQTNHKTVHMRIRAYKKIGNHTYYGEWTQSEGEIIIS